MVRSARLTARGDRTRAPPTGSRVPAGPRTWAGTTAWSLLRSSVTGARVAVADMQRRPGTGEHARSTPRGPSRRTSACELSPRPGTIESVNFGDLLDAAAQSLEVDEKDLPHLVLRAGVKAAVALLERADLNADALAFIAGTSREPEVIACCLTASAAPVHEITTALSKALAPEVAALVDVPDVGAALFSRQETETSARLILNQALPAAARAAWLLELYTTSGHDPATAPRAQLPPGLLMHLDKKLVAALPEELPAPFLEEALRAAREPEALEVLVRRWCSTASRPAEERARGLAELVDPASADLRNRCAVVLGEELAATLDTAAPRGSTALAELLREALSIDLVLGTQPLAQYAAVLHGSDAAPEAVLRQTTQRLLVSWLTAARVPTESRATALAKATPETLREACARRPDDVELVTAALVELEGRGEEAAMADILSFATDAAACLDVLTERREAAPAVWARRVGLPGFEERNLSRLPWAIFASPELDAEEPTGTLRAAAAAYLLRALAPLRGGDEFFDVLNTDFTGTLGELVDFAGATLQPLG